MKRLPLFLFFFTLSIDVMAEEDVCDQTNNVTFTTNDVFDLTDKGSIFLHYWANFLHVKTKQKTLVNESAFFLSKCQIDSEDLLELERHLRNKKYIRDASVKFTNTKDVSVETWDNWSLMPTVDFGRQGGKNTFAVGIKDRNLFGLGIDTEFEYFTNAQRSGFKLKSQFPLYLQNNSNISIRLTNNDDGTSEVIFLQKEFVSFDTKNAFKVGFDNFNQIDTRFENGVKSSDFVHKKYYSTANWQWLQSNSEKEILRFGLGYTIDKHSFSNVGSPLVNNTSPTTFLEHHRDFNYPFISAEYLEKDYRQLTNVNLIDRIEDYNLGWQASASLGSSVDMSENDPILLWHSTLSKGVDVFDASFLFFEALFEGELYNTKENKNRLFLSASAEYFHKFNGRWGGYFKNITKLSQNQFVDSPLVLGGDTGIRGYPLQYQHGKHSTQFTLEARYYPNINIYKLLELGAAAFIDTGRVFGRSQQSTLQSPWMTAVGLGARFYSTHSSEARVIHLDLIKPISTNSHVNNIEFRVTTKHSF